MGWRREPFRLFFPLGVVLGWAGVSHWLFYATGLTTGFSCQAHGLAQMQGFMMAFALGFLLTAFPRRTQSPQASAALLVLCVGMLALATAGALAQTWWLAEGAYGVLQGGLLVFAVRRFGTGLARRRPPAAFVLVPIGLLQGIAGAALIGASGLNGLSGHWVHFGRQLVEQGVFLCFVIGIGALVLPLIAGTPPPADLGSSPAEAWKAVGYAVLGVAIAASLWLEEVGGWERAALALRVLLVLVVVASGGAWRPPGKPGAHRRLVWVAVWMIPVGLAMAAVWPAYHVAALHVMYIGGFGLLAFAVATHVVLGHLDLHELVLGRPPAVVLFGVLTVMALLVRVSADLVLGVYVPLLGVAAGLWLAASVVWAVFVGRLLLRH